MAEGSPCDGAVFDSERPQGQHQGDDEMHARVSRTPDPPTALTTSLVFFGGDPRPVVPRPAPDRMHPSRRGELNRARMRGTMSALLATGRGVMASPLPTWPAQGAPCARDADYTTRQAPTPAQAAGEGADHQDQSVPPLRSHPKPLPRSEPLGTTGSHHPGRRSLDRPHRRPPQRQPAREYPAVVPELPRARPRVPWPKHRSLCLRSKGSVPSVRTRA